MDGMIDQAKRILMVDEVESFSDAPLGYRNRVDLVFFPGGLGMRESFDSFVDVEHLDLASDRVNEIIAQVRSLIDVDTFDQKTKRGALRYAVIRALDSASVSFVVNAKADLGRIREAISSFADASDCENVLITFIDPDSDVSVGSEYEVVKGSDILHATLAGVELSVHVQGFFQNNSRVADLMHGYIRESLSPGGVLVDLYGGVGSFACSLGSLFDRVVVIEEHEGAASMASENLARNGIVGEAICADASALSDFQADRTTIVTDPPRSGMSEKAARAIARLRPDRIVYVSCNPIIAPRDLAYFSGYSIEKTAVFDMFPGTDHFEMVVVLSCD